MKKLISTNKVILAGLMLAVAFSVTSCGTSKDVSEKKRVLSPFGIINLQVAIKSDNDGLRKSAIYYSGAYQVKEAVPGLISELENEKDEDTKLLIALALYRIGTKECLEAIEKFSDTEKNSDLRKVALSMLNQSDTNNTIR